MLCAILALAASGARAAPFASYVMDARTGQVLQSTNADTPLHPASLTKMMTLYITFEAIKRGEISLDTMVTVSANAANEPPSRLGLRAGQKIALRYLIRAAAIKSANDAATAICEAIGGSEAAFARRMNRTAKALGMTRSNFKNCNGLTEAGHLSTAHDMAVLGRHLLYDHPDYYNLFSRRSSDAGGTTVRNTNRKFLDAYKGADGIKTGYTVAAGFNLVASAERGDERIIAAIFGGTSTAARNAKMAELLDLGFRKAPTNARLQKPKPPVYADVETSPAPGNDLLASAEDDEEDLGGSSSLSTRPAAGKTIRVDFQISRSPIPKPRPFNPDPVLIAAMQDGIASALADAHEPGAVAVAAAAAAPTIAVPAARPDSLEAEAALIADAGPAIPDTVPAPIDIAQALPAARPDSLGAPAEPAGPAPAVLAAAPAEAAPVPDLPQLAMQAPPARPASVFDAAPATAEVMLASAETTPAPGDDPADVPVEMAEAGAEPEGGIAQPQALAPLLRPADSGTIELAAAPLTLVPETFAEAETPVTVSRLSTSGGRDWGVRVGTFNSHYDAERVLLRTALQEIGTLDEGLRKVVQSKRGYEADFVGLTEDLAKLACRRMAARGQTCETLAPG